MRYNKGDVIKEDALQWEVTRVTNYSKKGYQWIVAHRIKKDGTLGREYITFESDRYHKTFHRYKGSFV